MTSRLKSFSLGGLGERLKEAASFRRGTRYEGEAGGIGGIEAGAPAPPAGALLHHSESGIQVGGATTSEDAAEAALAQVPPGYFQPGDEFDALEWELRQLPIDFAQQHLEAVAEERTGALEVRPGEGWCCAAWSVGALQHSGMHQQARPAPGVPAQLPCA